MSDNYLYEIIESYKEAESLQDKDNIFDLFCDAIWNSKNKRRIYEKTITFSVRDDLLNTEIGQIFDAWSKVKYKIHKFTTEDDCWCELIRQKVNNLYSIYFDANVVLKKDYMELLKTPKRMYYQWMNGREFEKYELTSIIDDSMDKALELYKTYQSQKMVLSWNEYRDVVNVFFRKIFDNCQLISEYEKSHPVNISMYQDFIMEDNFYVKYFCNSIEFYIRNYQKEYYGLNRGSNKKYKRCKQCGALIENTGNKKMYCEKCAYQNEKERKKKNASKYRKLKVAK